MMLLSQETCGLCVVQVWLDSNIQWGEEKMFWQRLTDKISQLTL